MADTEFEEFKHYFNQMPQYIKAPRHCYNLVHDISPESEEKQTQEKETSQSTESFIPTDDNAGDDTVIENVGDESSGRSWQHMDDPPPSPWDELPPPIEVKQEQRRRRRLPDIPKDQKPVCLLSLRAASLADELLAAARDEAMGQLHHQNLPTFNFAVGNPVRPIVLFRHCCKDLDSSPCESDRYCSNMTDVDSGTSTAHSPDKSLILDGSSPPSSPLTPCCVPPTQLELLEATHRGLHRFIPRHHDEVDIDIGDPVYVQREADDLWCEGVNLRTGRQGIFPSAYVVDLDYSDFDPNALQVKKERYLLTYLGSIETLQRKGHAVVTQAVRKIVATEGRGQRPHPCILEISDQGIRMVDKRRPQPCEVPCHDYFYPLKHVSFCGFHPRDPKYLGFVTKHPQQPRFACHVFRGEDSTRSVAEAVGRAFQRFYQKFIETAYPIEDIYIE